MAEKDDVRKGGGTRMSVNRQEKEGKKERLRKTDGERWKMFDFT